MSSKTSTKQSFQPAVEIDDVMLARKREYWRSKKREQRARKSSAKKKIGNENLGLCMSVVNDEPSLQSPKVSEDPSLHNHDISCKLEDANAPKNSSSGLSISESNATTVPCQKGRWFQKSKLNHVLPQFRETSTNSTMGELGNKKIRSSVTGSSNTDAKMVESPCSTGHSVPAACIALHPNRAHAQKTKTGMSSIKGKQLALSLQSHVSMVLPMHSNQNKPQNCPQSFTSAKCKLHEERTPIIKRRTCTFASEHNTGVAMTEEEIAAKRRENWRIKKREQRAKHAAKLARYSEGSLGQEQPSCASIKHALSPANNKALRGINLNSVNHVCLHQFPTLGAKFYGSQTSQQHVQDTTSNHASLQPSLSTTQTLNKPKVPTFAHTQKISCRKQLRKCILSSKVESPEDRHARQKEYWRIKKREQRARLSMAGKARLKERDVLKHRVRCHHNSLNQMLGVQVNKASAHGSSVQAIDGFITEDGMVTLSVSETPGASLPASHNFPNAKDIGKVKQQVQVSSPLCTDSLPPFNVSSNLNNAQQNSLVKSRLARGAVMGSMMVTVQSETPTEEERVARLREYWRIKKREQRASRAAHFGNGLLRSKVLVLKQREQNKKSNQRQGITSCIGTKACDSSSSAPATLKEHIYPSIDAVFSIPEITPCISVKDSKLPPWPSSQNEPTTAVDHHTTTLQAVTSMEKLLDESVYTPKDNKASEIHIKCEHEPIPLTIDNPLTSNSKPSTCPLLESHNVPSTAVDHHTTTLQAVASMEKLLDESLYNPKDNDAFELHIKCEHEPIPLTIDDPLTSNSKPSTCPSLESHNEPSTAVDHHTTSLQAVVSVKELQEESFCTPKDNNATKMHIKSEPEPISLLKDYPLTSEDTKPYVTLQQNILLCDISEDRGLKDIKLSPQALTFEDTSHHKSQSICQEAKHESHIRSPVTVQPQCRNAQKFSQEGADLKQSCTLQALQEQKLGESNELQRKREYWRLMKRQQRARKANKNAVLRNLAPQEKAPCTSTCRQIPIQKKTSRCTKLAGPETRPTDKSRSNSVQILATPNPQEDPEEAIHRRRMQWRIKKQEQRARKAARERKLHQMKISTQGQTSQGQSTSCVSSAVQSIKSEDRLGYLADPCQLELKEKSIYPDDATEGPLSQVEWRNIYLIDFDPLNPLLVCMVCGEQQYSVSVEGVKAHIEEVHPDTLSLGDLERQRILDAWDKQVAIREHFLTHQLQNQCRASTGNEENCIQSGSENENNFLEQRFSRFKTEDEVEAK